MFAARPRLASMIRCSAERPSRPAASWSLLGVAVLVELRHIGPQVTNFPFALDAGEDHFGARDLGARIFDVFLECGLAPGDSGGLVGVAIVETIDSTGLAAIQAIKQGPDLVGSIRPDRMARRAFPERSLAGCYVLGECCSGRYHKSDCSNQRTSHLHPPGNYFGPPGWRPQALPTTNAPPTMIRMAFLRPPVNGKSRGLALPAIPIRSMPPEQSR